MKIITSLAISVQLLVCSTLAVHAATIFSSYPQESDPTLSVNEAQAAGVSFSPADTDYQITGLMAPLTFLGDPPSTAPQPVIFELWSSHLVDIGSGIMRQRPDSLLGSWTTSPVPASGPTTFSDVQVSITSGPTLTENSIYWFVVRAGWSGLDPDTHVRWAGSVPFGGFGYGERMLQIRSDSISPGGDNIDPGKLVAFEVSGAAVPEPSPALILITVGTILLLCQNCSRPNQAMQRVAPRSDA